MRTVGDASDWCTRLDGHAGLCNGRSREGCPDRNKTRQMAADVEQKARRIRRAENGEEPEITLTLSEYTELQGTKHPILTAYITTILCATFVAYFLIR